MKNKSKDLISRISVIILIIISIILILFIIYGILFGLAWQGKISYDSPYELLVNIPIVLVGIILLILGIYLLKKK